MYKRFTTAILTGFLGCLQLCAHAEEAAAIDVAPLAAFEEGAAPQEIVTLEDFHTRRAALDKIAQRQQKLEDNLAVVNQLTANNHTAFAYIGQSDGKGNLAIINQDSRSNGAVAMIFQSGSGARAIISQR